MVETPAGLRLSSLAYRALWEPGEAFEAACRRRFGALPWGRMPLHEAPARDCVCGVYAVESSSRARPYLEVDLEAGGRWRYRVLGTVSLWGRLVEGERGWRGELAYPAALFVPSSRRQRAIAALAWPYRLSPRAIAEELAVYAVPVEVLSERRSPRPRVQGNPVQ